jgi:hypothetical protein
MAKQQTISNVVGILVAQATDLLPTQTTLIRNKSTTTGTGNVYNNQIVFVVGTLGSILQVQGIASAYSVHARPADVVGCTAEYSPGVGWVGCLGIFATAALFNAYIPTTTNLGPGAWILVGNASTGTAMQILQ